MSKMSKHRNVGFLGANIFENQNVAQTLAINAKAINASVKASSIQSPKNKSGKEYQNLFRKLKDRFAKKCECSCDKTYASTQKNKQTNTPKNKNNNKN